TAGTVFTGTPSSTVPSLSMTCTAPSGTLYTDVGITFGQFGCTPSGGLGPYQYSISQGVLPPGLTMSGNSGVPLYISGALKTPGEFKFTVQVADSSVPSQTAQQDFDVVVAPSLTLTCALTDG